jgi:hypothetical protein
MRRVASSLLALSLVAGGGVTVFGQSASPVNDGTGGLLAPERVAAVASVLASDARFVDLPDFDDLRRRSAAEFDFSPLLTSGYYRVLGPSLIDLVDLGAVTLRSPTGWIVETTLVSGCSELPPDPHWPVPDPCAWRHTWIHLATPDGTVTTLYDTGDPEPMPDAAATPTG